MKNNLINYVLINMWIVIILFSSCQKKTYTIYSVPKDANVSISYKGKYVSGTTKPFYYKFRLKKNGYYPATLQKNDSFYISTFDLKKKQYEYNIILRRKTYDKYISSATPRTMDIYGSGILYNTLLADLFVKEKKVIGKVLYTTPEPTLEARNLAVADALRVDNADILVDPKFETEIVIDASVTKTFIKVTGYPATYKNFRNLEAKDIPLLKEGRMLAAPLDIFVPVYKIEKGVEKIKEPSENINK